MRGFNGDRRHWVSVEMEIQVDREISDERSTSSEWERDGTGSQTRRGFSARVGSADTQSE
ncbi:hypothetical protein GCM10009647_080380 [Streptomyces sanglieri]